MTYSILFITCPNLKSSQKISRHLLNERLVACVNILPAVKSEYLWEGKIESHSEILMIVKTKTKLLKHIEREVKRMHPYTVPEILSFKVDNGSESYLSWISEVVK